MSRLTSNLDLITTTPATTYVNANLGTAVDNLAAVTDPVTLRKVYVTNKHATNVVALTFGSASATTAVLNAAAAGAVGSAEVISLKGASQLVLDYSSNLSLWFCASAGSTPVSIVVFDKEI